MSRPRIEFPCDYPIKVIAESQIGLVEEVVAIVRKHDPGVDMGRVSERASRQGNYNSITINFRATGEIQLKQLFADLKECDAVRLVL
ncbi:MAG: DUF493 domain-containing protein [Pseudomonadales bacterium]